MLNRSVTKREVDFTKFRIPIANVDIGEEEADAVAQVILSRRIREGLTVERFEEAFAQYVGVRHAIAVSSGTSALICAMLALDIKPGDEVIIPSLSCSPPANVALGLRAKPIFADIEPKTYNIDPEDVKRKITDKTKAIIPIHYGGHPANLDEISELCVSRDIILLNDAAEALGARYKGRKIGTFGLVSVFSFSPNKTITTGEGGMITTNDDELAEKVRMITDYGQDRKFHCIVLGYNFKMTEMQAAIGIIQLKKINRILKLKRRNAEYMTKLLSDINGIIPPLEETYCKHAYMLYTIRVVKDFGLDRDELMKALGENGIQSRVYFPSLHLQPLYTRTFGRVKLPVTEKISKEILSLPSSPTLELSDVEKIAQIIFDARKHRSS